MDYEELTQQAEKLRFAIGQKGMIKFVNEYRPILSEIRQLETNKYGSICSTYNDFSAFQYGFIEGQRHERKKGKASGYLSLTEQERRRIDIIIMVMLQSHEEGK